MDPRITHFGPMEIVEVYEYYDRPLLFAARDKLGKYFLAVLKEVSGVDESWLYVAMSTQRFLAVDSGEIDLYSAFRLSELSVVLEVRVPRDANLPVVVVSRDVAKLEESELPRQGQTLGRRGRSSPVRLQRPALDESIAQRRDILDIQLHLAGVNGHSAPASFIGSLLKATQETIDSIAATLRGGTSRRGSHANETLRRSQMVVLPFAAGSFVVRLSPVAMDDLFGFSLARDSVKEFVALLDASATSAELWPRLSARPRVAGNLLALLRHMRGSVEALIAEFATPSGMVASATMSGQTIGRAIAAIESSDFQSEEEETVWGRLVGAHLDNRTFEIEPEGARKSISGKISSSAMAAVDGAVLGRYYASHLLRRMSKRLATEETVEEITLLDLRGSS